MQYDPLYVQAMGQLKSGRHCAEAVVAAILESFGAEDPSPAIKAASAFGGGIAGSTQELCGAFSGGVIALGSLLGRSQPGVELKDCARLTKAFKEQFLAEFGTVQCRPLLDAQGGEDSQAPNCAHITAHAASLLGGLLQERLGLAPGAPLTAACAGSGATLAPGACPFGGCGC